MDGEKRKLDEEKRELEISSDVLDVGLYAGKGLKKTGKREAVNTTAGTVKVIGGGVSLAPTGQVAGGVIGLTGAAIKPGRALANKGIQKGRDKKLRGFNKDKTTAIKDAKREDIANKMVKHRKEPEMKKIFASLPGVTQEQVDEFSNTNSKNPNSKNSVSKDDIQKLLKRRNY